MDPATFDQHARRFGQAVSRRAGLARLGAGLLALLGGSLAGETAAGGKPVDGQVCLRLGKRCTKGKRRRKFRCCGTAKCRQGKCRCSSTQRSCKGKCIPTTQCCTDRECGDRGAICRNGTCRCPRGQRDCQGTCIPANSCCTSGDCGECESCVDGQCVSGCQAGQSCVGGTCRCTTGSCPGCCDGDVCRGGDRDGACGVGGAVCLECGAHADCLSGVCQCDAGFQDCDGTCQACCGTADCPGDKVCWQGACEDPVCGNGGPCTVFIRSAQVFGNQIGGLDGADALCQASAEAEGSLAPSGTYKAWLSAGTGSPASRFMQSSGPYVRVDGTEIAANWADLTDGSLAAPINRSETGSGIGLPVWTNTTSDGEPLTTDGSRSCGAWNALGLAQVGFSDQSDQDWTNNTSFGCGSTAHLYCFQQS